MALSGGAQVSLAGLLAKFKRVQIPIIQRDYAQGREGHEELREEFLLALREALEKPADDPSLPLNLDFVYGNQILTDGTSGEGSFAPLDGQQRLTTLFLLHWYLAWRDSETEDFQARFTDGDYSLFDYEIRPSSHDFFNRLAAYVPRAPAEDIPLLEPLIEDERWFFRSWMHDPTIVSALRVLEDVHRLFSESGGYYTRLTDEKAPRITFQLLELQNFGLSDDLYIKMNARGKPLTEFENFKARLEHHLETVLPSETRELRGEKVTLKHYFSHQMDTVWADVFWEQKDEATDRYDEQVMHIIRAFALIRVELDDDANQAIRELHAARASISFVQYQQLGCLSARMLGTLTDVLDYWATQEKKKQEDEAGEEEQTADCPVWDPVLTLQAATRRLLSYPDLVRFAALCAYVRRGDAGGAVTLNAWMRVIQNLVQNTSIERPDDFVSALESLDDLEDHIDDLAEHLASNGRVQFFNRQQVREERIKAALILKSDTWAALVYAAEGHGYFRGQIEFLLDFSGILRHWVESEEQLAWDDEEDEERQESFRSYSLKAALVFGSSGLNHLKADKWRRALLALGDYTLTFGQNRSLLQDVEGKYPSWKDLLRGHISYRFVLDKRDLVRDLFDRIDLAQGLEESLDAVIESASPDEKWREMLVELPQALEYCKKKRMVRHLADDRHYLISKERTSSDHVELWSYHLQETTLARMLQVGELGPFSVSYRVANWESYNPCVLLAWNDEEVSIEIDYSDNHYRLEFMKSNARSTHLLEMAGSPNHEGGERSTTVYSEPDEIEELLRTIVRATEDE